MKEKLDDNKYTIRRSNRTVETKIHGCEANFFRLGARINRGVEEMAASLWKMNCEGCNVSSVFETGTNTKLTSELGGMRDSDCQKNQPLI
ncbi:MAG: hypothetical protein COX79_02340 [Candidatus Levybacteria bacterium CG_4_10_14_0_2_um_filter_36_16]|nr:MAG: hypothetical protein AUK12_02785 [Candidatus Levybacteria bacterium CG2_30_37_29]PIR78943.1 MAG: hypothetical protein COU26_03785 [Candidatus Levybacteria bacterium CG10_big_fil_rev_8_21_14_0_10_36_30]PIZ97416.1 MAG: hypothetical protein COX79_02340 [Candidatus Levybacteria bacterium CG_4_10_14_0_2_um_filter_36_16]